MAHEFATEFFVQFGCFPFGHLPTPIHASSTITKTSRLYILISIGIASIITIIAVLCYIFRAIFITASKFIICSTNFVMHAFASLQPFPNRQKAQLPVQFLSLRLISMDCPHFIGVNWFLCLLKRTVC